MLYCHGPDNYKQVLAGLEIGDKIRVFNIINGSPVVEGTYTNAIANRRTVYQIIIRDSKGTDTSYPADAEFCFLGKKSLQHFDE